MSRSSPDMLSIMPNAILDHIFTFVHLDQLEPAPLPLSRRLSEFFYRHFYRHVRVTSYRQLTKLCAKATTRMLRSTSRLTIDIPFADEHKESPDVGWPKDELVADFLTKFGPETDQVTVSGSSRLAQVVMSPRVTSQAFPNLDELVLKSTFTSFEDPFHCAHHAPLIYYTRLKEYDLHVCRSHESVVPSPKPFPSDLMSTLSPVFFTLRGPLGASQFCTHLIARFPELRRLALYDTSTPSTTWPQLVDAVVTPAGLTSLGIGCDQVREGDVVGVVKSLSRFPGLNRVKFRGAFPSPSVQFYSALAGLDLQAIGFSQGALVSLQHLSNLFIATETLDLVSIDDVKWTTVDGTPHIRRLIESGAMHDFFVVGQAVDEYYENSGKSKVTKAGIIRNERRMEMNALAPEFVPGQPLASRSVSPRARDHFSPLPPELLDLIFDLAHSRESPLTGPISTSLAHFWRVRHFAEVELKRYDQLASFATYVPSDTLALVKLFTVAIPPFAAVLDGKLMDEDDLPKERKDPGLPADTTLVTLFRKLTSVEFMTLAGSSRLCRLVCSSPVASTSFPCLLHLSLKSTFEGVPDPFHASNFISFKFYTELHAFDLIVYRTASSIQRLPIVKQPPPVGLRYFTILDSFHLRGPLSASAAPILLLALFPTVTSLLLEDSSDESNIARVIGAASADLLQTLSVVCFRPSRPISASSLTRLTELRALDLFGPVLPSDPSFYDDLATVPLERLRIGPGANVSSDGLVRLMRGPGRTSSSLKSLVLDNTVTALGYSSAQEYEFPDYTDAFTPDGLLRVVVLGGVQGIVVTGRAVRAFEHEDDARAQMRLDRLAHLFGSWTLTSPHLFGHEQARRPRRGQGSTRPRNRGGANGSRGSGRGRGRGQA
ncbi:hypothetical protein JCM11491_002243 [Sporobolomyces phaffii]